MAKIIPFFPNPPRDYNQQYMDEIVKEVGAHWKHYPCTPEKDGFCTDMILYIENYVKDEHQERYRLTSIIGIV